MNYTHRTPLSRRTWNVRARLEGETPLGFMIDVSGRKSLALQEGTFCLAMGLE
jgi:hypothetical protein